MKSLESQRLVLAFSDPSNARHVATFVTESREHLAPFGPVHTADYFTVAYWQDELSRRQADRVAGRAVHLYIFNKQMPLGPIIGQCALTGIVGGVFQAAYLGFGLHPNHQGHGYMTEALETVINYAFTEMKLHRIMANYMPTNQRSARVLKRLGFVQEGIARSYLFLNGQWQDHVLTALVNSRDINPE